MFLRMIPNAKLEGKVKLHRTTSRRLRTGRRDRPRGEVWLEKQGICAANIVYTSSVMAHVIGKCIGGIVRTSRNILSRRSGGHSNRQGIPCRESWDVST